MNHAPGDVTAVKSRSDTRKVVAAWLLAGTLDIVTASTYYPLTAGISVTRLLQGIASGLLGARAFEGGAETAALGVALHYLIALIWTLVFAFLVREFSNVLTKNRFVTGIAYGALVWLVMNLIVLPLSNVRQAPFDIGRAAVGMGILMVCIGLPIAMILARTPDSASRAH